MIDFRDFSNILFKKQEDAVPQSQGQTTQTTQQPLWYKRVVFQFPNQSRRVNRYILFADKKPAFLLPKAIILSGIWSQLSPTARAVYLSLQAASYDALGFFANPETNLQFERREKRFGITNKRFGSMPAEEIAKQCKLVPIARYNPTKTAKILKVTKRAIFMAMATLFDFRLAARGYVYVCGGEEEGYVILPYEDASWWTLGRSSVVN